MEESPKAPMNPKVKPALKHPVETKAVANADKHPDRHLTWDEHAIEEHDLLRGTRMKIEEPDTPYAAYEAHSDDDRSISSARSSDEKKSVNVMPPLSWNALESKLQVVADKRNGDACPPSPHGASDSEGEADMKRRKAKIEEHDIAFKAHRKKHYNEAEAMKRWRAEHMNDDDEEEEEETGVK